jgi:hypothetical protein
LWIRVAILLVYLVFTGRLSGGQVSFT